MRGWRPPHPGRSPNRRALFRSCRRRPGAGVRRGWQGSVTIGQGPACGLRLAGGASLVFRRLGVSSYAHGWTARFIGRRRELLRHPGSGRAGSTLATPCARMTAAASWAGWENISSRRRVRSRFTDVRAAKPVRTSRSRGDEPRRALFSRQCRQGSRYADTGDAGRIRIGGVGDCARPPSGRPPANPVVRLRFPRRQPTAFVAVKPRKGPNHAIYAPSAQWGTTRKGKLPSLKQTSTGEIAEGLASRNPD